MLADFFVATEAEAVQYDSKSSVPSSHRAKYKHFTEIELSTLYMITQGLEVDDEAEYEFRTVAMQDGGERCTLEILPDLAVRLGAASDAALASWATLWAATEELQCDGAQLLPVLNDLRRLSQLASKEGKSVYLWNCL